MYKVDYHHHSTFSFDGIDSLENICETAINNNLNEICFTEHFDVDPLDVSYGVLDYNKYHNCIEKCREKYKYQLIIKRGLEIGEPHLSSYIQNLNAALKSMDLDFIIGSVHNINSVKLRLTMPDKSPKKIYEDYFHEILAMIKISDIDVIGHLDLMKRYAFSEHGNYKFHEYQHIIKEILTIAIKRNIGIEINTSGLRNSVHEIYPKEEILYLYKKLGGEIITIGSDSHSCKDCFSFCDVGYQLLKDNGFKYIYTFSHREPIRYSL